MLKKYFCFFIILLNLVIVLNSKNREIKFEHIPIDISFGGVLSILEDRNGFIWFGTYEGLFKYDSNGLINYKYVPGDPNSLSDNMIYKLYEDKNGFIWVCTQQGLNMFDPYTENFYCYYPNTKKINSGSNQIYTVFESKNGDMWVGTHEGLFRFIKKNKKFVLLEGKGLSKNSIVSSITEDKKENLWIGTYNGLFRFNSRKKILISYINNKQNNIGLDDNNINNVFIDKNDNIFIGTNKGLSRYDNNKDNFISYKKVLGNKDFIINSIIEDRIGNLWIGTYGRDGLYILNRKDNTFTQYNDNKKMYSFRGNFIISIYENKAGIIWLCTNSGLWKVKSEKIKFDRFFIKQDKSNVGISNKFGYILLNNVEELLVGSPYDGLFKFNNERFTKYNIYVKEKKFINNLIITSFYKEKNGVLWVGTIKGLLRIDERKNVYDIYNNNPNNPDSLINNTILTIFEDKNGLFWLGTMFGLEKFDRKNNIFTHYKHNSERRNSLSNNIVTNIIEDSFGELWIGTNSGLNRFNKKKEIFVRYLKKRSDSNSISNNWIVTVFEDSGKSIWIGTRGGLNRYDRKAENFKVYTKKNGLIYDYVSSIIEDHSGNIWISTTKGLSIFNPLKKSFNNFNIGSFNAKASIINKKGEIFLGGDGLYKFSKKSFNISKKESPIVLTKFKIFNIPVEIKKKRNSPLKKNITEAEEIILDYKQNVFSFEFAVLDYSESENNRYSYKMEGFTKDWIELGKKNDITFTNLDHGKYVFKVKGKNSNGIWNKKGISIKVIITPPFWKTFWFKSISILLTILIMIFLYKKRIKKIKLIMKKEFTLNQFYEANNISEREKDVLELIVKGKTNREIEDILYISYHTVRGHVKNIYKKLNIKSKADLIIVLGPINSNTLKDRK